METLQRKVGPDDIDTAEVAAAFEWSRYLMPQDAVQRSTIDASKALLRSHLSDKRGCYDLTAKAQAAETEFKQKYPAHIGRSELRLVQHFADQA